MKSFLKKSNISFSLIALFFFLVLSCQSDDDKTDTEDDNSIEAGREQEINTLFDSQIDPLQSSHVSLTADLNTQAAVFTSSPSETNLNSLKAAWKEAFLKFKEVEIYNLGDIQSSFIHVRMDQWPINAELIEQNIAGTQTIDENYIASKGASSKGYAAIEYLLFHEDSSIILDEFTTSVNNENRKNYLTSLTENLEGNAVELQNLWMTFEGDFKGSLGSGVSGSQNQLANAIIAGLEVIKNRKMEEALNAEPADSQLLEAFYSETSMEAIRTNLETLSATYSGDFNGTNGYGMSEFVEIALKKPSLNTSVEKAFTDAFTAIDDINGPLETAISDELIKVEYFRTKITDLIVLFKVDISSAANIVVTFNDNDGD